jgi:hypothetical protein
MINEIRTKFAISDEEALYIKQITEERLRTLVFGHRTSAP